MPSPIITSTSVTTTYDIAYGVAFRQRVDMIVPNGTVRGVIFWFHGGGWSGGSKSTSGYTVGSPAHTINDESLANNIALGGYVVINCNVRLTSGPADGWNGNYDGVFPNNITDVETILQYSTVSGAGSLFSPHWATIYNYVNTYDWIVAGVSSGGHIAVMGVGNYGTATGRWPRAVISMGAPMDLWTNPPHTDAVDNPVNPLFESILLDVYTPEPSVDRKLASPRWRYGNQFALGAWWSTLNAARTKFYFYHNTKDNLVVENMVRPFAATLPQNRSFYVTVTEGSPIPGQYDHWFTTPLHIPIRFIAQQEFEPTTFRINSGQVHTATRSIAIIGDSVSTYGGLDYIGGNVLLDTSYVANNQFGNIVTCVQSLWPSYTVTNISRGGMTTQEALTGVQPPGVSGANPFAPYPNVTAWLTANKPDIMVLRLGLADSILINNTVTTTDDLVIIVNHAQSLGIEVVLIGVNPSFTVAEVGNCGYGLGVSSSQKLTGDQINDFIVALAQTRGLKYANPRIVAPIKSCSSPDGIHPFWFFGSAIVDAIAKQLQAQIAVQENSTMRFQIDTYGIDDATALPFEIVTVSGNITANDIASSSAALTSTANGLVGQTVIYANSATVTVTINQDFVTEGLETFRFRLRYTPEVYNVVNILDTSASTNYAVSADTATANEGSTITFFLDTANVLPGTLVPYAITGISSADITVGALTGNLVVTEPAVPRLTNFGVNGWRLGYNDLHGIFYRDGYIVIADEIYWTNTAPVGAALKQRADYYRSNYADSVLSVVVTPYTFYPLLLVPENYVIADIVAAGLDMVFLNPYYFADGTWTTSGLLTWTRNFADALIAQGLRVGIVLQGFARIGYVAATTAYINQQLTLIDIEEFVVFGLEDAPDLSPLTYVSLNNDFPPLTSRTNLSITLAADQLTEGTETVTLALTGPGRTESVSVLIADTSVATTTTTTAAPSYALTIGSVSIFENQNTQITYSSNRSNLVNLTLDVIDVVALSQTSFNPVFNPSTGTYSYSVTAAGLNINANRQVTIKAFVSSAEVASVLLTVQAVTGPIPGQVPVPIGGNLGMVLRGSYFNRRLSIPTSTAYALSGGSLPPGLSLAADGVITGQAGISAYISTQPVYTSTFAVTTTPSTPGNPYTFSITVVPDQLFVGKQLTSSADQPVNTGYKWQIPLRSELDADIGVSWVLRWGDIPPNSVLDSDGTLTVDFGQPILPLLRENLLLPNAPGFDQLNQRNFDLSLARTLASPETLDYQFHVELTNGVDPVIMAHTIRIVHFRISAADPASWFYQNRDYISYDPNQYYFVIMSTARDSISWNTNEYLGDIVNGTVSELQIQATHTNNAALTYAVKCPAINYIPQGLQLLPSGDISGRVSFRCYQHDPGNLPEYDIYSFVARASTDHYYSYTERLFTIQVIPVNQEPSDNIWIKAFPSLEQRITYNKILDDAVLFPPELIYKPLDPYWGVERSLRFLFAPGLNPTSPADYDTVLASNHYIKKLLFNRLRTAVAVDYNLNVVYEVVYLTVSDDLLGQDPITQHPRGLPDVIDLSDLVENYFQSGNQIYYTIKPNGLENMRNRLQNYVGYYNPGLVPTWMSSVQPIPEQPGLFRAPIGYIPAVVLAYTKPGGSNVIAQRCADLAWNMLVFEFDRYQLENSLSANWNTSTNSYTTGLRCSFDAGNTVFDSDTCKITEYMEYALAPEQGDKYLKFPTRGVYV